MKISKLGIGIIGVNLNRGWGSTAHVPAIQSLSKYEVTAICATNQESVIEAANHYGVPHAFTDPYDFSIHPDVDVVAITVKVPEHDKLVRAALNAGKHVYCEWPLARNANEAYHLLHLAEEKGVRHIVGLQSRANPAVNYVKDLLSSGYVGNILSVNVNYAMPSFSSAMPEAQRYTLDKSNGANQLTVTAGHLLDGITYVAGQFSEVSAILERQFKRVKIIESGEIVQPDTPDHVLVNGYLEMVH